MPQSLARVIVHLVYSTKHRQPFLVDLAIRQELYAYSSAVLQRLESPPIAINGVADHIHLLFGMSRKVAIMDVVGELKSTTSGWMKTKGHGFDDFYWQTGYGIFSVSESNVEQVKRYVQNQEEHHRTMSFQDEFRELCRRHGIEIDERYVWD